MAWYQGPCRITVTGVEAEWPQRAVVRIRGTGRTVVVPGEEGASELIDAASWDLAVEHRIDGIWYANVRAIQSRWESIGGVESQLVRSKDRDRPGDRQERSLVLRVERIVRGGETPKAETAATRAPVQSAWSSRAEPGRVSTSGGAATSARTPSRVTTSGTGGATEAPARTATAGEDWRALL